MSSTSRHAVMNREIWRRIAALIAVICIASVLVIPADAKTNKKAKKSTKTAQSVTVKYQKPDISGYDLSQYPYVGIGLGAAMGSAAPTTAGFGEAYAAGNWKDASYYLMEDLKAKIAGFGGPLNDHTVDELMTEDPSYPYAYYMLDGVRILSDARFASDGVMAYMPQLGKDFYISARIYPEIEVNPDTGKISSVTSTYYYGLGWFVPEGYCYGPEKTQNPNYLANLDQMNRDWGYSIVLRHPDAQVAQYISDQAAAGSMNVEIGYNQAARLGFWNCFKKVGFDMTAITPEMEEQAYSDCSSFVSGIVKSAGYVYNIPALKNVHEYDTTMTMAGDYGTAGFQVLNYDDVGAAGLQRGDILVNPSTHTSVYVPEIIYADKVPME